MASTIWEHVLTHDLAVPTDRPLAELTTELTTMLGSTDPVQRDTTAYQVLATWIERGVYDDLLVGLGDGMATGLDVGIGESGTDTVFRRSFSALVLAECLDRGNVIGLSSSKVLEWGDRIASWYVREQDLRGFVEGKGWAHAAAHGADAIGVLAGSPHFTSNELTVLLDVLADRLLLPNAELLVCGEPDRMAEATAAVLRRTLVPIGVLEAWIARLANAATASGGEGNPFLTTFNAQSFLRALYLKIAFSTPAPELRADLLLVLIDRLRESNPHHLGDG